LIILKYMSFYFCKFLWFDGPKTISGSTEKREIHFELGYFFCFSIFLWFASTNPLGKGWRWTLTLTVIAEFLGCSNNYWTSSANETEPYHLYSYKVQCTSSSIHSFFVSNAILRDQKATHYTYHQSGRTNVHARSWRHPHICNPNLLPILRERLRCT